MSIPLWSLLAFALWTIVILLVGVGIHRWSLILTGRADLKSFPADEPHGPPFYRRAMRAHANCVENLPIFGAIVVTAQLSGATSSTLDTLAMTIVGARLLQTMTHLASGSNAAIAVRFSFFAVQLISFFWMAALIVQGASLG